MKIGDLIRWSWYSAGKAFETEVLTVYQGIVIGVRMDGLVRVLTVVDKLGSVDVRADEAQVISESR
jgi:hypothetical protein